jgi:membrane protein implicated in regulation of membrane protease activity
MGYSQKVKSVLVFVIIVLSAVLSVLLIWQIALVAVGFGIRAEQKREQAERLGRRAEILLKARQELVEIFDQEWVSYQSPRLGIGFRY